MGQQKLCPVPPMVARVSCWLTFVMVLHRVPSLVKLKGDDGVQHHQQLVNYYDPTFS